MKIITIVNAKGGVGKTTLTQNMGVYLANQGYKTCLIDLDPQSNLSYVVTHKAVIDIKKLIESRQAANNAQMARTEYPNLFIIPNTKDLTEKSFDASTPLDQIVILKNCLSQLSDLDFILLDNSPSLNVIVFNSLIAADYVLIPVEFSAFGAMGIQTVLGIVNSAKQMNLNLTVLGIVPTRVRSDLKVSKKMKHSLEQNMQEMLLPAIRINTKFQQAQLEQSDIFSYEKTRTDKRGSQDIKKLVSEILSRL